MLQAAPPVLEFDKAGNLIASWGGPGQGYNWPDSNHGIFVDYKGNVWIGGNGRGPQSGRGELDESQVAGVKGDVQRQHGPEVHPSWQVPDADRHAPSEQRQQRYREPQAAGEDLCRPQNQ